MNFFHWKMLQRTFSEKCINVLIDWLFSHPVNILYIYGHPHLSDWNPFFSCSRCEQCVQCVQRTLIKMYIFRSMLSAFTILLQPEYYFAESLGELSISSMCGGGVCYDKNIKSHPKRNTLRGFHFFLRPELLVGKLVT